MTFIEFTSAIVNLRRRRCKYPKWSHPSFYCKSESFSKEGSRLTATELKALEG